jgi:hypothetical protein
MGNSEAHVKRGKSLSDGDVAELSNLSGFTPQQVREWHSGFLVSSFVFLLPDLTQEFSYKHHTSDFSSTSSDIT